MQVIPADRKVVDLDEKALAVLVDALFDPAAMREKDVAGFQNEMDRLALGQAAFFLALALLLFEQALWCGFVGEERKHRGTIHPIFFRAIRTRRLRKSARA